MALEQLAANPLRPVIDRALVTTGVPAAALPNDLPNFSARDIMMIEGRGILCGAFGSGRYLIQPDGAFAQLGVSRFGGGVQTVTALCGLGGRRWYMEYQLQPPAVPTLIGTGRAYALSPVTLQGAEDVGPTPPTYEATALLPDGTWLGLGFSSGGFGPGRWQGSTFELHAALPISASYFSWGDGESEIWMCNQQGEALRYDWRRRQVVGGVQYSGLSNLGMWYLRKRRAFLSLALTGGVLRVHVHATTPRPDHLEQTVLPRPTAGRVSRVRTRLLGSYNEPCEGEAVRWTAPPGYQIVPVQPVTDADGYAVADLIVPFGMAGGGSVVAEVVI